MRRGRLRGHRAFRIQQVVVARPQAEADQSPRIRHGFRLPPVVGLVAAHRIFTGLIAGAGRFAGHIMLANQRFLNRLRPLWLDLLLATRSGFFLAALVGAGVLRLAAVSGAACGRL